MSASPKQHAIRRSTRLPLEVPILVTSLDAALEFSEECKTTLVNAHGCGLITLSALPRDLPVRLEIVPSKRNTTARVADVVSLGGSPETWLVGMELDSPGNFWGIEYAPSDWKIEETPDLPAPNLERAEVVPAPQSAPPARRWRLTDISAGACFLEAADPLPIGTPVLMSVRVANRECLLDGIVRASHPQLGMGVEFTSEQQDHCARAEELISRLVDHREVPRVFVGRKEKEKKEKEDVSETQSSPGQPLAAEQPFDALLELVRQGDSTPVEKFLDDLKAQRLGQRAEPRYELSLPVQLSGTDTNGEPFVETLKTTNVSRQGAQLEGVAAKLRAGDKVAITCDNRTEDFRVAWVGASLTRLAGQIGVVASAPDSSLWKPAIQDAARQRPQNTSVRGSGGAAKK
jgi:hypothetical protein